VSSPADPARPSPVRPAAGERRGESVDEIAAELNEPRPAPPAHEPGQQTGATASERAAAQTAAELSDR
jgi:hypothetical protein